MKFECQENELEDKMNEYIKEPIFNCEYTGESNEQHGTFYGTKGMACYDDIHGDATLVSMDNGTLTINVKGKEDD